MGQNHQHSAETGLYKPKQLGLVDHYSLPIVLLFQIFF